MAEQTVRDRLLAALERIEALAEPDPDWPVSADSLLNTARRIAHDNLERAHAEPVEPGYGDGFSRREALLGALEELFDCHPRSIPYPSWDTAKEAFEAARSELQCPDGCTTTCPCYQEGLEAQREPPGGRTA